MRLQDEFFEGTPVLEELKAHASSESLVLSRVSSRLSTNTADTFLPAGGILGAPLEHLCRLIDAYPSLRDADIVSSESFVEPLRLGIVHRFLLLELRRSGRKTIWARLERLRYKLASNWTFILAGAQTRANDSVSLNART